MAKPFPPRMAAEMERGKKVGCRAIAVWIEDIEALAALAARVESAGTTVQQLNSVAHDLMLIIIGLTKKLQIYAPAEGQSLRADAEEIFKRWGEIQRQIEAEQTEASHG